MDLGCRGQRQQVDAAVIGWAGSAMGTGAWVGSGLWHGGTLACGRTGGVKRDEGGRRCTSGQEGGHRRGWAAGRSPALAEDARSAVAGAAGWHPALAEDALAGSEYLKPRKAH
jgi:hypothetical protein